MYKEPVGQEMAGHLHYKIPPSAYEVFMVEQDIPIFRGAGVYDVRQLPLAPWKTMGGRGTFIQLDGQLHGTGGGGWGMYFVEVPAGGELNAERHMYEEMFLVIEGRGSTEVWGEANHRKQTFEWQPGTHFAIPLNAWHRLVNATSSPALVLAFTSAPSVMDLFQSRNFVFSNSFEFTDRYDQSKDYFKPHDELETHPIEDGSLDGGVAMLRSSVIPDITHCYLPLDNRRGPGYRHLAPRMAGNTFFHGFIAEYPTGIYSKAHYHDAGAVLICLRGKGYSLTWPVELGPRPWEAGKGHLVKRQDYIPGGLVSAAPGRSYWYHQHFAVSRDVFRVRAIFGRPSQRGETGEEVSGIGAESSEGGFALSYREEDPQIRKMYKEALKQVGAEFRMPESVYH
jgi:quercetin dioxygenase-like cupin family protein